MKTKLIIIVVAVLLLSGATVVIMVREPARPKPRSVASELPTAMSNYQKTFKLDTSKPHFPDGKPATNQTNSLRP
jgi:hypothetical protein